MAKIVLGIFGVAMGIGTLGSVINQYGSITHFGAFYAGVFLIIQGLVNAFTGVYEADRY